MTKTKIIGGIRWETDPDGGWLTREPKRFLECRLECWVCERLVPLGDTRGYLRGWGKTPLRAVKDLLRIEQRLIALYREFQSRPGSVKDLLRIEQRLIEELSK